MIIPTTTNIKILHITRHQEFKTVPGIEPPRVSWRVFYL
ncbi:hypothetical protein ECDEC3A_1258 [Escherichia coli DEC3A]|nr:hypothetical protein ECDEC3A_1258 [Escherichia coli DEC3A]